MVAPWVGLTMLCLGYLALVPFSMMSYARIKKRAVFVPSSLTPPAPTEE